MTAMGFPRRRATATAALFLAAIAFAGDFVETDHHHPVGHAPIDLPTFAGRGDWTDSTLHVEGATRIESSSWHGCLGCLPQLRQLAAGTSAPTPGELGPNTSAVAEVSVQALGTDTHRLTPSRAPPRA